MTNVTGPTLPVTQAMPSGMSALTFAFAGGECGSENWASWTTAGGVVGNIPAFQAAGKKYIISTGGSAAVFTCGSDAVFT